MAPTAPIKNAIAQQMRQIRPIKTQLNQKVMVTAKYEAGKSGWQAAAAPLKPSEKVQKNCHKPARAITRMKLPNAGTFFISPSGVFSLLQKVGSCNTMPASIKIRLIMQ